MWLDKRLIPAWYKDRQLIEVDYLSDEYVVSAMVLPCEEPKRIVVYLRGGKGNVGQVRPVRLMQFTNDHTVVAAPYYRSGGDHGQDEFGGADIEDVLSLVRQLREIYGDLPLHFVGFSRGGIQGLLTYQKANVDSFITWGGVSDIYFMYDERQDLRGMMKRLVGRPDRDQEAYDRRNGYQHVKKDSPPVMIIHGTDDQQVNIYHAERLEETLKNLGVQHEIHIYQGEGHVFTPPNERKILKEIQQWMDEIEQQKKA